MGIIKTVKLALVGRVAGSTWGKLLLEQQLRERHFDPKRIPDECLQELADHTLGMMSAEEASGEQNGLSDRIAAIEHLAEEVTDWLVPAPIGWSLPNEGLRNRAEVSTILTKYGLLS
jgi:hypothetical protein